MPGSTRRKVLDAALACFLARGFEATSVADIRAASGASTGSIYHFFGSKAGLAIALWDEAIAGWRALSRLAGMEGPPEDRIRASVGAFLRWARDNPDRFRVYDEILRLSARQPDLAPIREKAAIGHAAAAASYGAWVKDGAVKDIPWPLARAAMMGPSLAFLQAGGSVDDAALDFLTQAAWDAVRTCGAGGKSAPEETS